MTTMDNDDEPEDPQDILKRYSKRGTSWEPPSLEKIHLALVALHDADTKTLEYLVRRPAIVASMQKLIPDLSRPDFGPTLLEDVRNELTNRKRRGGKSDDGAQL